MQNIEQALDRSEYGIVYITPEGDIVGKDYTRGMFEPAVIVRAKNSDGTYRYNIGFNHGGTLWGVQLQNPTMETLQVARAAFEPLGHGTRASWDTVLEWYGSR